jgi:hypothetical protein
MKIKIFFPAESVKRISMLGFRQSQNETLMWTNRHPLSNYGQGVLLRGKSGQILEPYGFKNLVEQFGAWIECDSAIAVERVKRALLSEICGTCEKIIVSTPQ